MKPTPPLAAAKRAALAVVLFGEGGWVSEDRRRGLPIPLGGLRIINVSNPAAPSEVGSYDTPGDAWGVAVAGAYAYVADGLMGLRIIDVSNPAALREVGFYDTPWSARGVAVAGDTAYVADGDGGLVILRFLSHRVYLPLVLRNRP